MTLEEAKAAFQAIFTIYRNPSDYPGHIVVRAWYGNVPSQVFLVLASVDDARAVLQGLYWQGGCVGQCVSRSQNDDPCIVESWI